MALTDQVPPDEAGYCLARLIQATFLDEETPVDASIFLHAYCWLLADLIVQAEVANGIVPERAIAIVIAKLTQTVERIRDTSAIRH